nr:large non-structural protein NS1 [Human parvovirus B19]
MELFRGVLQVSSNVLDCANDNWWCSLLDLDTSDWEPLTHTNRLMAIYLSSVASKLDFTGGPLAGCLYFFQVECNKFEEGYHIHVVIGGPGLNPRNLTVCVEGLFNNVLYHLVTGNVKLKFLPGMTTKGKYFRDGEQFIENYLMKKIPLNVVWCVTNIDGYIDTCISATFRRGACHAKKPRMTTAINDTSSDAGESSGTGAEVVPFNGKGTKASIKFQTMVNWLCENRVFTEDKWKLVDFNQYTLLSSSHSGSFQIQSALKLAIYKATNLVPTSTFLLHTDFEQVMCIKDNKIVRLLLCQNYDPLLVGQHVLKWIDKKCGKKNTLWFYGPPSTGKTNLAMAIAKSVPVYGMVNWNNENFPFNDVAGKSLVVWDEGIIKSTIVEAAKAILGGQPTRVDQKMRGSVAVPGVPVVITSNGDITFVVSGNTTTTVHAKALKERMVKLNFTVRCSPDMGLLTEADVQQWLTWCNAQSWDHYENWAINYTFDFPGINADALHPDLQTTPIVTDTSISSSGGESSEELSESSFFNLITPGAWNTETPRSSTPIPGTSSGESSVGSPVSSEVVAASWEEAFYTPLADQFRELLVGVDYVWDGVRGLPVCCVQHINNSGGGLGLCPHCINVGAWYNGWKFREFTPDLVRCSCHVGASNPFSVLTCKKCAYLSGLQSFVDYE